jgi:hypothetical protein
VAAILAGAVVALSILLAEGPGGPHTNFVVGPAAGAVHPGRVILPGRQAISVPPGARVGPGVQIPGRAFSRLAPLLPAQCLRMALAPPGKASASPAATPLPSASPGQSRISVKLPGGGSATCIITVQPAR